MFVPKFYYEFDLEKKTKNIAFNQDIAYYFQSNDSSKRLVLESSKASSNEIFEKRP